MHLLGPFTPLSETLAFGSLYMQRTRRLRFSTRRTLTCERKENHDHDQPEARGKSRRRNRGVEGDWGLDRQAPGGRGGGRRCELQLQQGRSGSGRRRDNSPRRQGGRRPGERGQEGGERETLR